MDCLDDLDVSIRLQALELAVHMVTSGTLQQVVNRLIKQLQQHPSQTSPFVSMPSPMEDLVVSPSDDGAGTEQHKHPSQKGRPPLPQDYRDEVLRRILDICSRDNYSDILDFEWYLNILAQLMRLLPSSNIGVPVNPHSNESAQFVQETGIALRVGTELRNVAVRVKAVRMEATKVAESFLFHLDYATALPTTNSDVVGVLGPVTWLVGEYAEFLEFPERTLTTLIAAKNSSLPRSTLSLYLQAIPKVFLHIISRKYEWNVTRHTDYSHLLTRAIGFLETLATHPDLEVQERAIEFLELLRLAKEAMSSQSAESLQLPFLVTSVVPGLFAGLDLNPVATSAQRRVPLPETLDLDQSINDKIQVVFEINDSWLEVEHDRSTHDFYHLRHDPANDQHEGQLKTDKQTHSYHDTFGSPFQEPKKTTQRRLDRKNRTKDDPFYIGHDEDSSGRSTPFHQVFTTSNGEDLDLDSIPIINLAIDIGQRSPSVDVGGNHATRKQLSERENIEITGDETFAGNEAIVADDISQKLQDINKAKRNFLEVDSSRLRHLSLDDHEERGPKASHSLAGNDDAEMIKAMQEVERLRLEMQRASERISVQGMPTDGTLVKKKARKKKKKKVPRTAETAAGDTLEAPH
jgi:AP-3 complex subunit delta-1